MLVDYYTTAFAVKRRGSTVDSGGAVTDTFGSDPDSGNCMFEPLSGDERVINDKEHLVADFRMFCDRSTDVLVSDEVRISSVDYKVVWVPDYNIGSQPHKEVYLVYES